MIEEVLERINAEIACEPVVETLSTTYVVLAEKQIHINLPAKRVRRVSLWEYEVRQPRLTIFAPGFVISSIYPDCDPVRDASGRVTGTKPGLMWYINGSTTMSSAQVFPLGTPDPLDHPVTLKLDIRPLKVGETSRTPTIFYGSKPPDGVCDRDIQVLGFQLKLLIESYGSEGAMNVIAAEIINESINRQLEAFNQAELKLPESLRHDVKRIRELLP